MPEKLLIGISASQATAARWRNGRLASCDVFQGDEAGLAEFEAYLGAYAGTPVYIAVDAVEEDYRFDTLPHAYGSDRVELIGRKLKQHYRNNPYVAASPQGREDSKRRDDRYLFAALTNPEVVAGWVAVIQRRELPVAGIYLLPTITATLVSKLQLKAASQLIVSQQSNGIRLTYFLDQQFRLSRLTRSDSARAGSLAQTYAEEISNTRLYLHALRTTTLDEHLAVLLLDREDALEEVALSVSRDNPSIECVRLGSSEIAKRLGIDPALLAVSPDVLFLQLLGQMAPPTNLAPPAITAGFRRHQTRRALYAAAGAIGSAGLLWIGYTFWQVYDLKDQTALAARQTAAQQAQYQEVTRQFPAAPTTAENLKRTVEIAQKLRESGRTPDTLMQIVASALEQSPVLVLRELSWRYGTGDIEATSGTGPAAGGAPPVAAPPPSTGTGSSVGTLRVQSGILEGEIRPFRGDYRAAVEAISALSERLAKNPRVAEVRVMKLPLNVNPGAALAGNTLDNPDQSAVAPFKLLLILKAGA